MHVSDYTGLYAFENRQKPKNLIGKMPIEACFGFHPARYLCSASAPRARIPNTAQT